MVDEPDQVVAIYVQVVQGRVVAGLAVAVDIHRVHVPVFRQLRQQVGVVLPGTHLPVDEQQGGLVVAHLAVVDDAAAGQGHLLFGGAGAFDVAFIFVVPMQVAIGKDAQGDGQQEHQRQQHQ